MHAFPFDFAEIFAKQWQPNRKPTMSADLTTFLQREKLTAPIAVILAEDEVELDGTVRHHAALGFGTILVIGAVAQTAFQDLEDVHTFHADLNQLEDSVEILNQIIKATPTAWLYYCFNAEYLFFPYSEHRSIKDAIAFMEEERRTSVFTYTIDLYPENLSDHRAGVDLHTAHLDQNGYYGMDRYDGPEKIERQPEIFGGLRWRFEEHIPWEKRRIDRIALFKTAPKLTIGADLRLSDPEMNTISCEWHNNLTMAIMSFRVAKTLMHNPGSAEAIDTFSWGGSSKFEWNATQLMELGFMEPGQWF